MMLKRSSQFFVTLSFLIFAFTSANAATVTTFSDRTNWETAVGTFQEENFNSTPAIDPIPNNTVFDFGLFNMFYTTATGIDEVVNAVNLSPASINGSQQINLAFDTAGTDSTTLLELQFDSPVTAFGATWNGIRNEIPDPTSPFGPPNLKINVGGATIQLNTFLGPAPLAFNSPSQDGGFLGFTSDMPFSSISFTADGTEIFHFDDAVLSTTAPVPAPSALLLMGSGLVGVVGWQWWRAKKV